MASLIKKFIGDNRVGGSQFRVENNTWIRGRNSSDTADLDMFKVNTSNNIEVGRTFVPDASDTRNIGTDTNRFSNTYSKNFQAGMFSGTGKFLCCDGSLTDQLEMFSVSTSAPDGNAYQSSLRTIIGANSFAIYTASNADTNSNPTGDLFIGTGNKTSGTGNSGAIIISPGSSSGGTRGKLKIKDGSEGTVGDVWTSTGVNGEGEWQTPSGGGGAGNIYRGASVMGPLIVETNAGAPIYFPENATIQKISAYVRTAPTGASLIIDVNKNGTTIFTTQANRPTITSGSNEDASAIPDVTSVLAGDVLEIDVDQIGSGDPGEDLVITIQIQE